MIPISVAPSIGSSIRPQIFDAIATSEVGMWLLSPSSCHRGGWRLSTSTRFILTLSSKCNRLANSVEANISLKETDGEDPIAGRFDLRFHALTPFIPGGTLLPFGARATARLGYQRWGIHYLSYRELGHVRIRTKSSVSAWGPNLSLGLTRSLGRMTWSLQGSAYRLDADNRVWVPGVRLGASIAY